MNDCAFKNNNKCSALTTMQCEGCNFYKTREQVIEGRLKAAKRIESLPKATQKKIRRKYYSRGRAIT